ncbi:hypothetical protein JS562_52945 [Agrobacterium sp. S2]|nr:hypothetical protein [Agrobacterium sp. S2]
MTVSPGVERETRDTDFESHSKNSLKLSPRSRRGGRWGGAEARQDCHVGVRADADREDRELLRRDHLAHTGGGPFQLSAAAVGLSVRHEYEPGLVVEDTRLRVDRLALLEGRRVPG